MTDLHVHTAFSADGKSPMEEILSAAKRKKFGYIGFSEHFDCRFRGRFRALENGEDVEKFAYESAFTDADRYFSRGRALQKKYAKKLTVLLGAEMGFVEDLDMQERYCAVIGEYRPDFVINSVHKTAEKSFYKEIYKNPDGSVPPKAEVYGAYFETVEKSLDAIYPYDIVGHLAYCARYAPYEDRRAAYADFKDPIDRILKKIIAKGKILEANTSYPFGDGFLPDSEVFARYYELGGRKVSFGSDAHAKDRIGDKRERVIETFKEIGFTHLTVPVRGEHILLEI
ncbi:MAG: histidinol-phosphatase HisJ family protein [Clostridia bacterium]|nr:histidinol-phosphatase HisJ family protein [Clostridia bacterium]